MIKEMILLGLVGASMVTLMQKVDAAPSDWVDTHKQMNECLGLNTQLVLEDEQIRAKGNAWANVGRNEIGADPVAANLWPREHVHFAIAHELAHILHNHSPRENHHHREYEADATALKILHKCGYDVNAGVSFFSVRSDSRGETHPSTADRQRAVQRAIDNKEYLQPIKRRG